MSPPPDSAALRAGEFSVRRRLVLETYSGLQAKLPVPSVTLLLVPLPHTSL
jgi:hypothetical protein